MEGGRAGEKHQCTRERSIGCLSCASYWGPGRQPRHVPWLGIEPVTFWFTGWCSIHWATPARVRTLNFTLKMSDAKLCHFFLSLVEKPSIGLECSWKYSLFSDINSAVICAPVPDNTEIMTSQSAGLIKSSRLFVGLIALAHRLWLLLLLWVLCIIPG